MVRAVTAILTLMWLGLLAFPASADAVGLAGVGALLAALVLDRLRHRRTVQRGQWGR